MGNCLITKLNGVVDNDNLPFFDKISVKFLKNASEIDSIRFTVGMKEGETSTITSKACTLLDFTTKQNIPSMTCGILNVNATTTTSTKGDVLYADNMYNITTFFLGSDGIVPSDNLVEFEFEQLRNISLNRLHIQACFKNKQFNDFSFLDGSVDTLETLQIGNNGTHWEDVDLMYLTKFTHLKEIIASAVLYKPMDYKQFALGQIANGRTSGSISCIISSNNLFNGESISSGKYKLTWTSAEDITFTTV